MDFTGQILQNRCVCGCRTRGPRSKLHKRTYTKIPTLKLYLGWSPAISQVSFGSHSAVESSECSSFDRALPTPFRLELIKKQCGTLQRLCGGGFRTKEGLALLVGQSSATLRGTRGASPIRSSLSGSQLVSSSSEGMNTALPCQSQIGRMRILMVLLPSCDPRKRPTVL